MDLTKNLRERCHVNTNDEGDSFVGVKADTTDAVIYFPIGYQLPENDDDLRVDVNNLFGVLASFMKEDKVIESSKFEAPRTVDFPMHAYLKIIRDYLRVGRYYIETDPIYKTDTRGRPHWAKTIRDQTALIQKNGSFVFTQMTVRVSTPNANKQITQIHRYCVYEAFDKLGWIYTPYMPEKPRVYPSKKESIYILQKKLANTNDDVESELFTSMISLLKYQDEHTSDKQYYFGTDYFDRVWERMVDKAFGIENKDQYFPKTRWLLDYGRVKNKTALQPDTIMIFNDKVYVLDAKFYRYGCTANADHLPNGQDINKQITYAEYIEKVKGVDEKSIYNAFIMPFNRENNLFYTVDINGNLGKPIDDYMGLIGEAVGEWKTNPKNYERIQGVVIDTRFLMYNYISMPNQEKQKLANQIEKVNTRGAVPKP